MPNYADPERNKAYLREYHRHYIKRDRMLPPRDTSKKNLTEYTYKGVPITLEKIRGRPVKVGGSRTLERTVFPKEHFIKAGTIYAATGSPEKVAETCQVPLELVKEWIKKQEFKDLLEEIRNENDQKIDAKFTEIVESALEGLSDRIQDGDSIYDSRRGEMVKKPISAKDLASISVHSIDKRQLLRGKPTSRTENIGENQRLEQLAEQFIKMTQKKTTLIEGEFVEVVPDVPALP